MGQEKILKGIVTQIVGNRILFKASTAAVFDAETTNAKIERKDGTPIQFSEIIIGDKVTVQGKVWPDNSVNAGLVRDMSLYVHVSTFSGKVSKINPTGASFIIQSRQHGTQEIFTDNFTAFKTNGLGSAFKDIALGIPVKIKGAWQRSYAKISARTVEAKIRMVNISITGQLVAKNPTSLTVVANNVPYGIDASNASITNTKRQRITVNDLHMGMVKVFGKHIPEGQAITAISVKESV